MRKQIAAILLAGLVGISGLNAVPAMADAAEEQQAEEAALTGIHEDKDQKLTGNGFVYTLNKESQRIRILGISEGTSTVAVPGRIGTAVVDFVGLWQPGQDNSELNSVQSVTLPDTVTTIGTTTSNGRSFGFAYMTGLEHVTLTNAVTDLGDFSFYQDEKLQDITIPEYLTKIGNYVFSGCKSIKTLSVPTGVTSVGNGAFSNMTSLTEIYIPKSLKSVGNYAFSGDSSLEDIYYEGTEEEWNQISWGTDASSDLNGVTVHYGYHYADKKPQPNPTETLYRLYNPDSGEHFYTANAAEKASLVKIGWKDEGTGWTAPLNADRPVYRLYNPNAGDHHYTMNRGERDALVKAGWSYEGIGWQSAAESKTPVYRQYNPNAKTGAHNYTTSLAEANYLISVGWRNESIGWYGE